MLNINKTKNREKSSRSFSDFFWRSVFFIVGLFLLSLGMVAMIQAQLGVSPWTVLEVGLHLVTAWSIGFWNICIGALLLLFTYILDRRILKWGTIIGMLFVGIFIDLIIVSNLVPPAITWWTQSTLLIVGIVFMGLGTALYLSSHFGAGSRDGLMLAISERLSWSIRLTRTLLELCAVCIGWLLGGPVFIGTILFSIFIGPILQFFLYYSNKLLSLCTNGRMEHKFSKGN